MYRTSTCNDVSKKDIGKEVILCGWVNRRRDHGGVIFVDLRDRYGITQIVSDPENFKAAHDAMNDVRSEFVLQVTGKVRARPDGQANLNHATGEVEIFVTELKVLNTSKTPPFEIDQDKEVGEDMRLKYRYLDLRKTKLKSNIILRHKIIKYIRDFLDGESFIEVETPILIKGTPEGSREYLVPSRLYPGTFYVLPQSPQQLKQLLMVAGFDKYFQIARCFRDEDQRGDRQPEFTQLDMEMSFIDMEDIMKVNESLMIDVINKFAVDKKIMKLPFPVLTYEDAMNKYGSDKPDIRFEMAMVDVSDIAGKCEFSVFKSAVENGGVVKALKVDGGAKFTRREIDEFTEIAKIYKAKGLAYIVVEEGNLKSPIVKYFKEDELKELMKRVDAKVGDIVFFAADKFKVACESLGHVRLSIGSKMGLMDPNLFAFCWVIDFPMFEVDDESGAVGAVHHPFTAPKHEADLDKNPELSIAKAYDIVLNGTEVGGGSIRIHDRKVQARIFEILGISNEDAEHRFGHMLEAFQFGAPPHGGIAWGLDRLVMIIANEPNIREVIAFPKDSKAKDLMLGAPSEMPQAQLEELSVKIDIKKK
ncbi:MAG: aspartate--tRNA ligase [Candidatus Peregrinibacteria bacterium]|nr:aspartate--tRNA ligase [Candidatus Peregrinibacteria bacterium]